MLLIPFVILSFATMRLARLVVKDDIFKEWRQKLVYWLANGKAYFDDDNQLQHTSRRLPKWRDKLVKLVSCPYCVTAYTSGVGVILWHFIVEPLQAPVFMWLAVWAGSLVVWEVIDGE